MNEQFVRLFVNTRGGTGSFNAGMFRTSLMLFRRYFFALFFLIIISLVFLAAFSPFEAIGYEGEGIGLSEGDEELIASGGYLVPTVINVPVGGLWDVFWFIRGQLPGFYNGTGDPGYFAIIGLTSGLNAPTTVPGIFFEGVVDITVYLPLFLNPGFTILHLDMAGMFMIKIAGDLILLGGGIALLFLVLLVLTFFSPLLLMRLWVALGPLMKLIIVVVALAVTWSLIVTITAVI